MLIPVRIYSLDRSGKGIGVPTGGEFSGGGDLKGMRIEFKLSASQTEEVFANLKLHFSSQPIWELEVSAVQRIDFAPPGSTGWAGIPWGKGF